jgi:hypothetical protein
MKNHRRLLYKVGVIMTHQEAERRQKGGVEVTRRADPVYA